MNRRRIDFISIFAGGSTNQKTLAINNSGNANELTDYPVKVSLTYVSGMQADFSDIRFVDSDKTTSLNFWIESYVASTSALVWVKVPTIPASSSKKIYMNYGDTTVDGGSDGFLTFTKFEHFDYFDPILTGNRYSMIVKISDTYYMVVNNQTSSANDLYTTTDLDGTWTAYGSNPVLALGAGGAWDDTRLAWGSIGLEGGTYYMLYGGSNDGSNFKGGLATSTDLITWTKDVGNPIINEALADICLLTDIDRNIVKYDGQYWAAWRIGTDIWIAHATAMSGPWTKLASASLVPSAGEWDSGAVGSDSFIYHNGQYYILYRGYDGSTFWAIGFATASAPDGTWTKSTYNPILEADEVWDGNQVLAPTLVLDGSVYHMFYTGSTGASSQIGHVKANTIHGTYARQQLTNAGTPVVADSVVTLQSGDYVYGSTTYQYVAVRFRANFVGTNGDSSNLKWAGLINGATGDRTVVSTQRNQTKLYINEMATSSIYTQIAASVDNAYKVFEQRWKSGEVKAYIDDTLAATDTTQPPVDAIPLSFRNFEDAEADLLVDWLLVRQYSDPEPSVTIS